MATVAPRFWRQWVLPMVLLTSAALAVFSVFYLADFFWAARVATGDVSRPLGRYLSFDPQSITDAVGSLAGIIAAVFGIVITVASIIVQLSANRYAGIARQPDGDELLHRHLHLGHLA